MSHRARGLGIDVGYEGWVAAGVMDEAGMGTG